VVAERVVAKIEVGDDILAGEEDAYGIFVCHEITPRDRVDDVVRIIRLHLYGKPLFQ
jgi:hypothetical protein